MLRGLMTCFVCLLVLGACAPALAEVSVRTDRAGEYLVTQVFYAGAYGAEKKIWSPRGLGVRKVEVLNPQGDANGDLWPEIREDSTAPYHPLVVWSRFNGVDFDLVWSTWTGETWRGIEWVFGRAEPGDDLDASLVFDSHGRPYLVWWRDEPEGGRIYASALMVSRWTTPFLISDPALDSRYPSLEVNASDQLAVTYETKEGTVFKTISFAFPDTITDDINPQIQVDVESHHVSER